MRRSPYQCILKCTCRHRCCKCPARWCNRWGMTWKSSPCPQSPHCTCTVRARTALDRCSRSDTSFPSRQRLHSGRSKSISPRCRCRGLSSWPHIPAWSSQHLSSRHGRCTCQQRTFRAQSSCLGSQPWSSRFLSTLERTRKRQPRYSCRGHCSRWHKHETRSFCQNSRCGRSSPSCRRRSQNRGLSTS